MNNFKCNQIRQTSSMDTTLLDVCTTNEFKMTVYKNAKNISLAVLPLLAQQYFEKDEPVNFLSFRQPRDYHKKTRARMDFTDVTNMGGTHHYQ